MSVAGAFLSLGVMRLPTLSPDGRRLVYVIHRADLAGDGYVSDLTVTDLSGGPPGAFTFSGAVTALCWDRAGTGVWLAAGDGVWHMADAPDSPPERLWKAPGVVTCLSPHPGDDRMLVSVARQRTKDEPATRAKGLRYKADGRGILSGEKDGVWLVAPHPAGGEPSAERVGTEDGGYAQARWSPDGSRAMAMFTPVAEELPGRARLTLIAGDGGDTPLTETRQIATYAWLPHGDGCVVLWRDAPNGSPVPLTLASIDLNGAATDWDTKGMYLAQGVLCDWRWPALLPPLAVEADGKAALTTVLTEGSVEIWRFPAEGEPRALVAGPAVVGDFTADRAVDRIALTRATPVSTDELHLWQRADGRTAAVADANRAFIARLKPRSPLEFTITAADGGQVPCWWLAPEGAGPHPTVLVVHGGPHGAFGRNLYLEHQLIAQAGIAVLWANPRGSTGYGQPFAESVIGRWGVEDMEDLMGAVDHAVRNLGADPERLAIMGTSYGGFMSSWVIGHNERFRTAVVQAPVTDLISMYGESDIGHFFVPLQVGADPNRDLMTLWERSPLRYVPRVTASVLLVCGEADERCPVSQTEEYFVALVKAGREVEFLRYPGEPHGLSVIGTPRHRLHRQTAVVDWLRRHLA